MATEIQSRQEANFRQPLRTCSKRRLTLRATKPETWSSDDVTNKSGANKGAALQKKCGTCNAIGDGMRVGGSGPTDKVRQGC
jgi:hypothetical protein